MNETTISNGVWSYAGKRVIVSGCFSGIGYAVAAQLVALGADVHGLDWKMCDLALSSFTPTDLRQPAAIDAAVAGIGGAVDALFNCAGVPPGAPPSDVMKVNFIGARHLTERVLPLMPAGSAVANVASTGGAAWPEHVPALLELVMTPSYEIAVAWCEDHADLVAEGYRLSKEAMIVWTMSAAAPLIRCGVRINATSPGAVQTPMLDEIEKTTPAAAIDAIAQPAGRRSTADEQASVLLMLNSAAAAYVNGVILPVDGGFLAQTSLSRLTGGEDANSRKTVK